LRDRQEFIKTYDSLGSETVLLAIVQEIIESLGARNYGIVV